MQLEDAGIRGCQGRVAGKAAGCAQLIAGNELYTVLYSNQ
jgi:hypothetical protein